jgi:hypothetical protein
MVEQSQAGFEVPIFIKKNLNCVTHQDTYDDIYQTNIVLHNGIVQVGYGFAAPYTSFATFCAANNNIQAVVANVNTGEVRYYDGTQGTDPLKYIDPIHDSVGLVDDVSIEITRPVTVIHEVGSPVPADLKETVATYKVTLNKMYSNRWRTVYTNYHPADVTKTDTIVNPIGLTGIEGVINVFSPTSQHRDGYSPWFLVIIYARDNSDATAGKYAHPIILPCCKFESVNPKAVKDGIYTEQIKITALDMIHLPADHYQTYLKGTVQP